MSSNSAGIGGLLPPQTSDVANYILTTDGQTASWEVSSASLPSQTGHSGEYLTTDGSAASWAAVSALPDQTGNSGKFLTTDGSDASWATVTSGVNALAAVGSAPAAEGASISGTTLTLQPADATHPGVVSDTTQSLKGAKTFVTNPIKLDDGGTNICLLGGTAGLNNGLWLGVTPGGTNYSVLTFAPGLYLNAQTGGAVHFMVNNAEAGSISATVLDLTSLGAGGSIKLKSPDGTTYTATIANGGTWSIA
jgi:hypothetical protein